MADLAFTLTNQPDAKELQRLGDNLALFNDNDVGPSGRLPLAVLVHAEHTLVAGLSGYTAWGWLYVQWLWVDETYRGQRLAVCMLAASEAQALERGCHGAYIDTFNPTALAVYQKAGYTVWGALPEFPRGRTRSFLSKALR